MMKNLIYQTIKSRLEAAGEVKHIALWNQQVQFIEEEAPFATPAVFVEFGRIEWTEDTKTTSEVVIQRAKGTITLHVVTSAYDYSEEATLVFSERINKLLKGLSAKENTAQFNRWVRTDSQTNHNHEDLVESLETFKYIGDISY
ncbi:MAG: hypothetical protein ACRCUJ_01695 [Phocaeicola sp.]